MIFGIGTDILELKRVEETYQRFGERFVQRLLMPEELAMFPGDAPVGPISGHALRGQGGDREGDGHRIRERHVDTRCRRDAGPTSAGRRSFFRARGRRAVRRAWDRRRPPHAVRRGGTGGGRRRADAQGADGSAHDDAGIRHRDGSRRGARPAALRAGGHPGRGRRQGDDVPADAGGRD